MTQKPPAGVNEKTGEVEHDDDEVHVRPFAELLTLLDRGAIHDEASRGLHDLLAAVQAIRKKGTMTITIDVAPIPGSHDQVIVAAQVATKPPKTAPKSAMFFIDGAGNLSRSDPNQPVIEGLTIVEPKPAKIVEV